MCRMANNAPPAFPRRKANGCSDSTDLRIKKLRTLTTSAVKDWLYYGTENEHGEIVIL